MTDAEIKAFVDGFTTEKMNTGDIKRRLLAHYVNVGTESAPEWEMLGYKVEESSIEYNWDIETITDIRGITTSSINKSEPSIGGSGNIEMPFTIAYSNDFVFGSIQEITSSPTFTEGTAA